MEINPKPCVKLGAYLVSYSLDRGFLTFYRPTASLTMLAPPEFRAVILSQNSIDDANLVLKTSMFVEHIIMVLDSNILFASRD
jgi:hypothetical protein